MEQTLVSLADAGRTAGHGEQILQLVTFRLDVEEYAVDILSVQEINVMQDITRMPNCPDYMEGIVNLRGKVIPVVNLRKKFGMKVRSDEGMGKIMITDIHGMIIGLVVDSVNEVLRIPAHIVEPPPALSMNTDTKYIKGIAKMQDRLIILIQLEKLFDLAELSSINSTAATQA